MSNVIAVSKPTKIASMLGRNRGQTRKSFLKPMAEAEDNYQSWRKAGFKGAWWWQYFKGSDAN